MKPRVAAKRTRAAAAVVEVEDDRKRRERRALELPIIQPNNRAGWETREGDDGQIPQFEGTRWEARRLNRNRIQSLADWGKSKKKQNLIISKSRKLLPIYQ